MAQTASGSAMLRRQDLFVNGNLRTSKQTPGGSETTGVAGTITFDDNYIYVCVGTDSWKRVALSTW